MTKVVSLSPTNTTPLHLSPPQSHLRYAWDAAEAFYTFLLLPNQHGTLDTNMIFWKIY